MNDRFWIGIDVGTTSLKTILMDSEGRVVATTSEEYPLMTPQPQWAEQNPEDWWKASCRALKTLLHKSNIDTSKISGVGLTGQMHGSVFLDKNDEVIRPALLWCDQRTQEQCDDINNLIGIDNVHAYTQNRMLTGFTAPKILWMRKYEPENYSRLAKVLLPKDYIRLKLTGAHAADVSDASGTGLFDPITRKWSQEMLEALKLPASLLSKSYESIDLVSHVNESGAVFTGVPLNTPVIAGAGDQAAGGVGCGAVSPGIVSASLGTSGVLFASVGSDVQKTNIDLHTFCHAVPNTNHVMGVMLSAGGSLRWFCDTFCQVEIEQAERLNIVPYTLIDQLASKAPAGSEGLIFLPYLTGERTPNNDPLASGAFVGITARHTKGHFARAVMEGVAFGMLGMLELIKKQLENITEVRITGGGAKSKLWCQIMTDVLGVPHVTLKVEEGPAFGAAILAAVNSGRWSCVEEASAKVIKIKDRYEVIVKNYNTYQQLSPIYKALYPTLKNSMHSLSKITVENESDIN